MPNLYALVVGIDNYPPPVPILCGCVNDANAFRRVLLEQYNVPPDQVVTLLNADATREAVIDGFREHLCKAKAGDIAVFFYAGHGSQEPTTGVFLAIEPDYKNETIVCYDSRLPRGYDLAHKDLEGCDLIDKDFAVLIQNVAATGARLTLVLDSCHSGSADRDADDIEVIPPGVRRAPAREEPQPDSAYLRKPTEIVALLRNMDAASSTDRTKQARRFVEGASGSHVLFAACSDSESANEYHLGPHGAFTYCLLQVLLDGKPISNQELYTRTHDLLQSLYPIQHSHLVPVGDEDELRNSQFLGLTPMPRGNFFMAWCDRGAWKIDGGRLYNLGVRDAVALYPANSSADNLADTTKALTTATLTAAGPSESTIAVADVSRLDPQQQYKAVVTVRAGRINIRFDGDPTALTELRSALEFSVYVQEGTSPRFIVRAGSDGYQFELPNSTQNIPGPFDATPDGIQSTVAALEHMARWTMRVELSNESSSIAVDDVDLAVSYYDKDSQNHDQFHGLYVPPLATLPLQYRNDQPPSIRMRVTNRSSSTLNFAFLVCSSDWQITTAFLPQECITLNPTEEIPLRNGDPITMTLKPGATEAHDHMVLVISRDPFDAAAFALPKLTNAAVTRDIDTSPAAPPPPPGDFATRRLEIITRR
jgi:hypothetical protein